MLGRWFEVALRAGAWALLLACSSTPGGTSGAAPVDADPADAASVAAAPLSTPSADAGPVATSASSTPRAEGCSTAETLRAADLAQRSVLAVSGTTAGARDTSHSELGSCAGANWGPDVWYQLDLTEAGAPLELQALVDARFDATVELRRGPCGDTLSMACDRASALSRASSTLSARVEPGVYWLVIDGADATSAGDFTLQVELDPLSGCATPATNLSCETAVELAALEHQSVLIDEACAVESTAPHEGSDDSESGLYYELDLSAEAGPVLTSVAIWSLVQEYPQFLTVYRMEADLPDCGTKLAFSFLSGGAVQRSNAELKLLLPPGRYVLEIEPGDIPEGSHVALTLDLDRQTCAAGAVGNDCAQAIDLDPTVRSQVIDGSTQCNTSLRTILPCGTEGEDAPEQFHRLDLRSAPGSTRARLTVLVDGLNFMPLLYVLSSTATGECGEALYCDDAIEVYEGPPHVNLMLEPGVYFVGIDGAERGMVGTYRLLVELEAAEPSPCVTTPIDDCMAYSPQTYDCCGEWSPLCSKMVALCGLSPATQACVCASNPACCESSLLSPDCSAAQLACNYLCPEFAPTELSCLSAIR